MSRDMRIVNMSPGQLAEYDKVFKRQGEIAYRDMGVLSKIALFNSGKALITEGLRVASGGGMVVTIPTGSILQRITSGDILPCISTAEQTITMDAASGSPRTDIIECQVKSVTDKDDTTKAVLDPTTGVISLESIKRDLKYYLAIQKKTGSTDATAATAGVLSGTVGIAGTIDLSSNYLLNIADGEDGSFQEIDLRGSTPEATTKAEIISAINSAVGRTMASTGAGDTITLTGLGTGETSYFEIKPPVSNSDADALQTVFGVSGAGVYNYIYKGVNDWIKLCEIDIGAATTVITPAMIRNVDDKSTWASDDENVITAPPAIQPLSERDEATSLSDTDLFGIETADGKSLKVPWSLLRDILYPIGDIYVQYPVAESNTELTAFPLKYRPTAKFGGTWSELYDDENIFFRTKGTDGQTRTNGLSEDQMQRITGSVGQTETAAYGDFTVDGCTGAFSVGADNNARPICAPGDTSSQGTSGYATFDSANSPNARVSSTTSGFTEPRNRLFKVWIRTA